MPLGIASCFNPRPRTVGDGVPQVPVPVVPSFQPTPTHGGRLAYCVNGKITKIVSTHAHARWATFMGTDTFSINEVFQPTPTHGGRPPRKRFRMRSKESFNPRPRTVGDVAHDRRRPAVASFNPRPRTVGDVLLRSGAKYRITFQPTPTHGGRRVFPDDQTIWRGFQPTPTHGGRLLHPDSIRNIGKVSTHAHARWATGEYARLVQAVQVSTHAHARWATRSSLR